MRNTYGRGRNKHVTDRKQAERTPAEEANLLVRGCFALQLGATYRRVCRNNVLDVGNWPVLTGTNGTPLVRCVLSTSSLELSVLKMVLGVVQTTENSEMWTTYVSLGPSFIYCVNLIKFSWEITKIQHKCLLSLILPSDSRRGHSKKKWNHFYMSIYLGICYCFKPLKCSFRVLSPGV